jgi:transcription factor S
MVKKNNPYISSVCFMESIGREKILIMEFCPSCGCRLEPKKIQEGSNAFVLACSKCGYTKKPVEKNAQAQTGKIIQPSAIPPKPFMTVITEEDQKIKTMQTIKMKCEKCDNNLVYVWQVQTRGGDEASTQFMRCT